jgi:GxxExxY protein
MSTMHPLFQKADGLTENIIAAAIEVHRDKGPGLIESIYEWCLLKELELRSLACLSQKLILIKYKGLTREEPLRFDVLVEGCVLVEAKAVEKNSSHPQGPAFELHETTRRAHRPADQFPRDESDRRRQSVDSAWSKPMTGFAGAHGARNLEQEATGGNRDNGEDFFSVLSVASCLRNSAARSIWVTGTGYELMIRAQ